MMKKNIISSCFTFAISLAMTLLASCASDNDEACYFKMAPFYIRKEDKDMIKRKIDRYLADFFKTDKKRVCHIP